MHLTSVVVDMDIFTAQPIEGLAVDILQGEPEGAHLHIGVLPILLIQFLCVQQAAECKLSVSGQ